MRMPAAFRNIFGFKPTLGLVPDFGSLPGPHFLTHVGPMTRTLVYAALLRDEIRPALRQSDLRSFLHAQHTGA